jgi:hypothetical protein
MALRHILVVLWEMFSISWPMVEEGPLHGLHAHRTWILWMFTCGDTYNSLCMQLLLTTKRHFTIALWLPVRLSATTPASLNGCGGPCWDVSRRALNLMEGILSIYYKSILSAITYKLNVSGRMLIWTFLLVLVCGTRAQSLSAPFSYTLYTILQLILFRVILYG